MQMGDSYHNTPLKGKVDCAKFTRIHTNGTRRLIASSCVNQSAELIKSRENCCNEYDEKSSEDFSIDPMLTNCQNLSPIGFQNVFVCGFHLGKSAKKHSEGSASDSMDFTKQQSDIINEDEST
ncbi:hypothetical protein L1049_022384 [Liquidambar formosana]|uniref:Uncharacterized protein n=1 Tax=Liquidambar formosana TaxID=63359 RepID=A0AAP0WR76_LIQFO